MKLKLSEIDRLPSLTIDDKFPHDDDIFIEGRFTSPVERGLQFFYNVTPGSLSDVPVVVHYPGKAEHRAIASYTSNWDADWLGKGARLPIGTYDCRELRLILDLELKWEELAFHASDCWSYVKDDGWRVSLGPGGQPPTDARNARLERGGWDHEHCAFCWETIAEYAEKSGFVTKLYPDRFEWVCSGCYKEMIVPHRLRI
ncbi:MAG TPA: hypothetical protein VEJ63_01690 [Planctomycetota bacterium]|nr:hypothetical protein [Planctomycetota bacterium]